MLSPELLKKAEKIYFTSKHLVSSVFSGEFKSAFRGRGMEFEEVREYQPGDDIRTIDWNVTARMDNPFVKVYREEREQTIMLIVDVSASHLFGTTGRTKKDIVAELAAVLAFAAITNNDKVGLILFSDRVEKYIPPKKGKNHVFTVISEILSFTPKGKGTRLDEALLFLGRVQSRKSTCFLISDFQAPPFTQPLKLARLKHEIVALQVADPMEEATGGGGFVRFIDLETGTEVERDIASLRFISGYPVARNKAKQALKSLFASVNVDSVFLKTSEDYIQRLLNYFRWREKKV